MGKYLIKSLLEIIPVLFIISFIVFFLVHVTGDPVALMLPETATDEDRMILTQALGLDRPLLVQYGLFMQHVITGDFGMSMRYNQPALSVVVERIPASLELALSGMAIATAISIPFGILSAVKRNTLLDVLISGLSVVGKAMPNFWIGIMLILLFSVTFHLFPVSGRGTPDHLVLPAITLGTGIAAEMTRLVRSSMLEILAQDHIRTARSKGLREFVVVCKHALSNAMIPVITIFALQFSQVIGGTLVTETVFAWPGLGQLIIHAVNTHDMPIIEAAVFVVAIFVICCNLAADLALRLLDPRIKYD